MRDPLWCRLVNSGGRKSNRCCGQCLDADGDDSLRLSGDDANAFEIDSDGALRFITAPDFEVDPPTMTVGVSDGSDTPRKWL